MKKYIREKSQGKHANTFEFEVGFVFDNTMPKFCSVTEEFSFEQTLKSYKFRGVQYVNTKKYEIF